MIQQSLLDVLNMAVESDSLKKSDFIFYLINGVTAAFTMQKLDTAAHRRLGHQTSY